MVRVKILLRKRHHGLNRRTLFHDMSKTWHQRPRLPKFYVARLQVSMIHSSLRQPPGLSVQHDSHVSSTVGTSEHCLTTATLGSHRARIRVQYKPPVPRQNALTAESSQTSDHVHVAAPAAKALLSSANSTSAQSAVIPPKCISESKVDIAEPTLQEAFPSPNSAPEAVASPPSSSPSSPRPEINDTDDDTQHVHGQTNQAIPPVTTQLDAAAAAVSALEQRSKALKTAIVAATQNGTASNDRGGDPKQTNPTEVQPNKDCSPQSSSLQTAQPPGDDLGSASQTKKTMLPRPRTATAVPLRHILAARPSSSNGIAHRQHQPPTLVGSTKSLLRGQRSNSGQTLTESANQVVASMMPKASIDPTRSERGRERRIPIK